MDIKKALLAEHSKKQCDKIVKYIGNDAGKFSGLMKLFFEGEYRVVQRAAWPMCYCVASQPELIRPYFSKIINNLDKKNLHNAVPRNSLRLLQGIKIPKRYHGKLMNICFAQIQSNETPVAIKAFSITILQNLSEYYPDIISELKFLIKDRWERETPAFRSRAKNILKQ